MDNDGALLPAESPSAGETGKEYVVVARRYRPQTFAELVGQEHVARALTGAITSNRVGHAYLFTGARGVGKTSAARILAKCLNCFQGPSPVPCNQCDSCQAIASGDDVDVLEIDGASNRGIEEMRELRHNVGIRPSRSRFKIYIIDEVHMLTREAFNALLKTLEEPPEHVKFIFCTTEAEKIPVTILSRCQRFDFAGIEANSIVDRLRQIVDAEGIEAEPAALVLLSRRAGGSMRDSQSLLEQLLSVGGQRITVDDVNQMLGTASDERLARLVSALIARDAGTALGDLDEAVQQGVDVGQLLDQVLIFFRDLMVAAVGGTPEMFLTSADATERVLSAGGAQLGLQTLLAMMQILDHTIARLRYSMHARVLAELALVRICQLEDLDDLATLIDDIRASRGAAPAARPAVGRPAALAPPSAPVSAPATATGPAAGSKSPSPRELPAATEAKKKEVPPGPASDSEPLIDAGVAANGNGTAGAALDAQQLWQEALSRLSGLLADSAARAESVTFRNANFLAVTFAKKYHTAKDLCEHADQMQRMQQALSEVAGRPISVGYVLSTASVDAPSPEAEAPSRAIAPRERVRDKARHPLVSKAMELFDARPIKVEEARD